MKLRAKISLLVAVVALTIGAASSIVGTTMVHRVLESSLPERPVEDVSQLAATLDGWVICSSLLFALLGIAIGALVSRRLARPLAELAECESSLGITRDITERRRQDRIMAAQVRLSNYATDHSVDELLQAFLDEAEALTDSEIGFYHFVARDQETLELHAWSTNTLENLCTAKGRGSHYSIQDAGVWVDCVREGRPVIHNDYACLPHRKGLPEGHAPVVRELVVPVVRSGSIVAILGVGNKATDYGPADVETVSELARMAWDIVGRKRAEAEGSRLLTAIDQSTEAVVITDPGGLIQYVNPAFERTTGYSREEAMGQNPSILKSGEHDEAFYASLWHTISAGKSWHGQFTNRKKDGTLFVEDATISPVRDASGRTVNYVAVKRDITHEVELEEQLRQAQKMEAVGQLAGGIAHDFNNLLQAINGYAGLALESLEPDDPAYELIEEVSRAERRAARQVRQLLAFSRRQVLDMKDVDLNDVVASVVELIHRVIGEHITLEILAGSDLSIVRVDPGQMELVLLNLAVNARDAMQRGGMITIATENVVLDEEFCRTHPQAEPGPYVLMSVSDTGCGMDAATLANAFEPFFTTKDVDQGTGLGLSTAYGIVRQHQGIIRAHSEVGLGTVFRIYLPALRRSGGIEAPATEKPVCGGTETILLAEDDEQVLRLAIAMLERAGYKVLAATDGEEALRVFEEHLEEIDLAMLDVVMPKVGGHEVCSRIGERRPDLPFVFASGYGINSTHTDFALDEGKRLIQKPYQRADLLRTIRSALDGE